MIMKNFKKSKRFAGPDQICIIDIIYDGPPFSLASGRGGRSSEKLHGES